MNDVPARPGSARPVHAVAVIGAGVMGSGIAQVLATSGVSVRVHDLAQPVLIRALEVIEHGRYGLRRAVELHRLTGAEADAALARITPTVDRTQAVGGVDLVIEAVNEDLELKVRLFRDLDREAPNGAILASNSSGFPIAALAGATDRPENVIGWHWASPTPVMRSAEIVAGRNTSADTIATVAALATRVGKRPVVVRDDPMQWGYVADRIFMAAVHEARRVVECGLASAEDVDQLMRDQFRWPAGPLELTRYTAANWEDR